MGLPVVGAASRVSGCSVGCCAVWAVVFFCGRHEGFASLRQLNVEWSGVEWSGVDAGLCKSTGLSAVPVVENGATLLCEGTSRAEDATAVTLTWLYRVFEPTQAANLRGWLSETGAGASAVTAPPPPVSPPRSRPPPPPPPGGDDQAAAGLAERLAARNQFSGRRRKRGGFQRAGSAGAEAMQLRAGSAGSGAVCFEPWENPECPEYWRARGEAE